MAHRGNSNTAAKEDPANVQQKGASASRMEAVEHRRYGPSSLATAFGLGVGVGVVVGMVLSHQPRVTSFGNQLSSWGHDAEKLGRTILDSMGKIT